MKKILLILILILFTAAFFGCSAPETNSVQMGNPWTTHSSLKEAEKAVGFPLGLPETVADTCRAEEFRDMNGELLEVVYIDGSRTVTLRKAKGTGQDISGDYTQYDTTQTESHYGIEVTIQYYRDGENASVLVLFSRDGFSYSLSAPDGFSGDSFDDFLRAAAEE